MNACFQLKNKLRDAKKIAVLGVGSDLRADDAAGMFVAKNVGKAFNKNSKVRVFLGGIAPENFTGEIKKFNPTHIIIIDCADFNQKPGAISFIDPKNISGVSFSTHTLPLNILADYIARDINCETLIIGIQPKTIEFEKPVSKEVKHAIKTLSDILIKVIYGIANYDLI